MPTIFKNRVSFDLRIYGDCKKHIARHRRLSIFENLVESVIADGIAPNEMEQHDKMFQPENIHEETFWKSCREIAKTDRKFLINSIENGKKGGRPAQPKPVEQPKEPEKQVRGSFVPPTLEEVLEYAKQMNSIAGMGGFLCSRQTATDFFNHYQSQGWLIGNGIHMTDWKPRIAKWAKIEEKNALEQ